VELQLEATAIEQGQIGRRAVGGVSQHLAGSIVAIGHGAELATVMRGGVRDAAASQKSVLAVMSAWFLCTNTGTATNGMLTIVIDPSRLIDREWLRTEIAAMTQYIIASPPQHPDEPVLIPGDPERLTRAERLKNGVPIDDETWRELTTAARGINVLIEPPG
jgi:hypothetical protein